MANHASGAEGPSGTGHQANLDAEILRRAIRESISTSPEAFLKTIEDVENRDVGYWEKEISSSTWVAVQRGDEVVGIAVARRPEGDFDWAETRFIESVWIAPELRGSRIGERLMRFLFEVECAKSPSVWQFLLWVFDKNSQAIRLYERMGFKYVERQDLPDGSGRTELRYEYRLEADSEEMKTAAGARQDDLAKYGVIYRVLGEETE